MADISKGMMEDYTGPDIMQEQAPPKKKGKKDKKEVPADKDKKEVPSDSDSTPPRGMAHGGKVGRGCGAAVKGGGSVMKSGKRGRL